MINCIETNFKILTWFNISSNFNIRNNNNFYIFSFQFFYSFTLYKATNIKRIKQFRFYPVLLLYYNLQNFQKIQIFAKLH